MGIETYKMGLLAATIMAPGAGWQSPVPDSGVTMSVSPHFKSPISGQPSTPSPVNLSPPEKPTMSDMTREELDAKLEAVEARASTREATLGGKIDLVLERLTTLSSEVGTMRGDLKGEMAEVVQDNKNTRITIAITVIGATLAALGALWTTQGSMVTAMGNQLSSFQAGLSLSAAHPQPATPLPEPVKK